MNIGIIGHFGIGENLLNGQTIKSKNLVEGLKKYGKCNIILVDTYNWKKKPLMLFKEVKNIFKKCDAIIMLPAHNGVRVFAPMLLIGKKIYQKKIYYDVIGGWLVEFIEDHAFLYKILKKFDGIWVETLTMRRKLNTMGFDNIEIVPNFKDLQILDDSDLVYSLEDQIHVCTFSRVMKQKGIEDAVQVVCDINRKLQNYRVYLDIYGQVESGEEYWFEDLKRNFTDSVTYMGQVAFNDSVKVLKKYDLLLFPTLFYTEGIPGTIIDAYAAGLPVIASRWENFSDIVEEGYTGVGYIFGDVDDLERMLMDVIKNRSKYNAMKINCLKKAKEYSARYVVEIIMKKI